MSAVTPSIQMPDEKSNILATNPTEKSAFKGFLDVANQMVKGSAGHQADEPRNLTSPVYAPALANSMNALFNTPKEKTKATPRP